MAEKTIALPLSGDEIRLALLDMVDRALRNDCFLHPAASYDFFVGKITIDVRFNDMGREDAYKATETLKGGTEPPDSDGTTVSIDIEKKPPNQMRIETNQPVPTESGKKIKYARTAATAKEE